MVLRWSPELLLALILLRLPSFGQDQSSPKPKPRVVVIGLNGMELDVIRPLLLQGKMPSAASAIHDKVSTATAP